MDKTFIFGVSVTGDNFTDRVKETQRLKMNFGAGVNTILISLRRMGKTSLVKKVISETDRKYIWTYMIAGMNMTSTTDSLPLY